MRVPQLLKVREACGGCWAAGKSQDRSEKSRKVPLEKKMGKTQRWMLQMVDPGSYEALSEGDEPGGRIR